jgi:hypothetical protein
LEVLRDNGALVIEGSRVNEESEVNKLTVRDLIMGSSVNISKTTLQPLKASNMHPLTVSTIFGYEFADIVMDSPSSELKKSSLEKEAWPGYPCSIILGASFAPHLGYPHPATAYSKGAI